MVSPKYDVNENIWSVLTGSHIYVVRKGYIPPPLSTAKAVGKTTPSTRPRCVIQGWVISSAETTRRERGLASLLASDFSINDRSRLTSHSSILEEVEGVYYVIAVIVD